MIDLYPFNLRFADRKNCAQADLEKVHPSGDLYFTFDIVSKIHRLLFSSPSQRSSTNINSPYNQEFTTEEHSRTHELGLCVVFDDHDILRRVLIPGKDLDILSSDRIFHLPLVTQVPTIMRSTSRDGMPTEWA